MLEPPVVLAVSVRGTQPGGVVGIHIVRQVHVRAFLHAGANGGLHTVQAVRVRAALKIKVMECTQYCQYVSEPPIIEMEKVGIHKVLQVRVRAFIAQELIGECPH